MKRIFSIFVATLLLSTTLLAQNEVAEVRTATGTTKYETIEEAMTAWQQADGTLTLLKNCDYAPTGVFAISKKDTLNLNGHTLNWTADATAAQAINVSGSGKLIVNGTNATSSILNFDCKKDGAYAINAAGSGNTLRVNNIKISAQAQSGSGRVVNVDNAGTPFSMENATIEMGNYIQYGVYLNGYSKNTSSTLTNVTISYVGTPAPSNSAAVYTKRSCVYENLVIDMQKVVDEKNADKICFGISVQNSNAAQTLNGDKTSINMNKNTNSTAFNVSIYKTFTINAGKFTAPIIARNSTSSSWTSSKMVVNGGKFSTALPYDVQTPTGKILQKGTDGYYTLVDGAYKFAIIASAASDEFNKIGFTDAASCWNVCSSDAAKITSVKVFTQEDFAIPAGKYIQLYKTSNEAVVGTITNNGNLTLASSTTIWNNKIINNGTLSLGTSKYGDNFELVNTGNVVVVKALFTEKALKQVINYIPAGYGAQDQGNGYYKFIQSDAIVATVGGLGFDNLSDALKASTKDNPAKLCKDYTMAGEAGFYTPNKSKNQHCYLDLNGFNIIDKGSDQYLWNNVSAYLTIQGKGSIISKGNKRVGKDDAATSMFHLQGVTTENTENYSVLEIGKDVTIENENFDYIFGIYGVSKDDPKTTPYANGVRIDFAGKVISKYYLASVSGTITNTTGNVPTINIASTAEITCQEGIYAAGYAKWNFAGQMTAENYGVEIRAGEFTMNGGSIEATMNKPADDQFNGNGSTSQACAIAVCQHSTKLPIKVTINGGSLKAYTPIYQANPQNNPQEAIDQVSVEVNNAENGVAPKIYSTSKNIVWSANKKVVLNGGVYNMNPSAYAAEGKVVVANTGDDKDVYPYAIGDVQTGVTFSKEGDWSTAANWSGTATAETPVTIAANVTISGKAEAYGVTVSEGKTITIKKGGVLVVGKDGISGMASADQLIIEDGGYLLISPAATTNNQPLATVKKVLNIGKKASYEEGESPYMRRHIGIPTLTKPELVKNIAIGLREWDVMNGWQNATDVFEKPFKGYSVTTDKQDVADVDVAFKGKLIGNNDVELSMYREGFFLFANSWVAPLDANELLNQLNQLKNEGKVEANITVFVPEDITVGGDIINSGRFFPINEETLKNSAAYAQYWGTVAPLTGFFLHANTTTAVSLNYEKAAWNVQLAKKSAAPKRVVADEENNAVRIKLTAANNRQDNVYIYDGKDFHSTKMMNNVPNVNIFVEKEGNNYSTFASEDLEGTVIGIQTNSQTDYTLSFDWLKGETLYIKDLQTGVVTAMTEDAVYKFTATANETSSRFVVSRHNAPTAIDGATVNTAAKGVYSITGQYLGESNVLETLPQGIYVVDGKKYIK